VNVERTSKKDVQRFYQQCSRGRNVGRMPRCRVDTVSIQGFGPSFAGVARRARAAADIGPQLHFDTFPRKR
jgi:hypothetical protein